MGDGTELLFTGIVCFWCGWVGGKAFFPSWGGKINFDRTVFMGFS